MTAPTSAYRDDRAPEACCPYCGSGLSAPALAGIDAARLAGLDTFVAAILERLYWESDTASLDAAQTLIRDEEYRAHYRTLTGRPLPTPGVAPAVRS